MSKPTEGDWQVSTLYREHGMGANDGSIAVVAYDEEGVATVPICNVVMHAEAKRGQAYKVVCPERDANAYLLAAAKDLLEVARRIAEHFKDTDAPLGIAARAALAKASPPTA